MEKLKEILIVEDNALDATLLKEYLDMAAIKADKIVYAERLKQVLDSAATSSQPDLIFLDINLPDSNGLETFLSVNGTFPYVPIIVLSGQADTEVALQAIQAGAQDYLLKGDFDEKFLAKTIQYSIERKRNQIKLQESSKRYEIVSKATNDPVFDWDILTNKIVWNDKVNIFGYPDDIRKDQAWWLAYIHFDDIERVTKNLDYYLKSTEDQWSDNYRFRCADGSYKYIQDRRYILRDSSGKPYRMIAALQDITDQVLQRQRQDEEKTKQQKAILRATLEGQERERSEIGKELHDNINQILASVKLMITASIAQTPKPDNFLLESIKLTDECIQEIRRLSNSLVPLREREMELIEAIQGVVGRIKSTSGLSFDLAVSEPLSKKLRDDQQLTIYRIIQEQINNILKHANAKKVSISLQEQDKEAVLIITDDGIGFGRHDKSRGIGLSNMKSRTELLNGRFFIDSEPGKGCTLTVNLPLNGVEQPPAAD
jgi:two-component system, NarL family, sensor histidine kinase UhpB